MIQQGLENLIRTGVLTQSADKWSLAANYRDENTPLHQSPPLKDNAFSRFLIPATDFIGRQEEIRALKKIDPG